MEGMSCEYCVSALATHCAARGRGGARPRRPVHTSHPAAAAAEDRAGYPSARLYSSPRRPQTKPAARWPPPPTLAQPGSPQARETRPHMQGPLCQAPPRPERAL